MIDVKTTLAVPLRQVESYAVLYPDAHPCGTLEYREIVLLATVCDTGSHQDDGCAM
jgi:hypothetical protein